MITSGQSTTIIISDDSGIGEARRMSQRLAEHAHLPPTICGNVGIIATELARNAQLHASGGEMLLHVDNQAIQIVCIDRGRGIVDVARALQDGFSTAGTAGEGLGAVARLSTRFDIFSTPGAGTVAVSLCKVHGTATELDQVTGISVAKPRESVCGDGWAAERSGGRMAVMVCDGLGHGLHAHEASKAAIECFRQDPCRPPEQTLEAAHVALRKTRGAAVAVAVMDRGAATVSYAGVGNITASIIEDDKAQRRLMSYNGIVGFEVRKFAQEQYAWPPGGRLIMFSDGVASTWDLARYSGLLSRDPALLAGAVYRDHRRERDDATVVVAA